VDLPGDGRGTRRLHPTNPSHCRDAGGCDSRPRYQHTGGPAMHIDWGWLLAVVGQLYVATLLVTAVVYLLAQWWRGF